MRIDWLEKLISEIDTLWIGQDMMPKFNKDDIATSIS